MRTTLLALTLMLLCGCNKQIIDINYRFDKALVKWPDGTCKTLAIKSWRDYEDGDQIQMTDTQGNVYLVHACNVVLLKEAK